MKKAKLPPLIVVAGGGHARVLLHLLEGREILGILEATPGLRGKTVAGVKVLGGDEAVSRYKPASVQLVNAMGVGADTAKRRLIHESFKMKGYAFASVVAADAHIAPSARLAEGAQVISRAVVHPDAVVGAGAVLNTGAILEHDAVLGDHAFLGPGAIVCGGASVGSGALIGAGAVVLPGVKVGAGARLSAGAVARKEVPAGTTVF